LTTESKKRHGLYITSMGVSENKNHQAEEDGEGAAFSETRKKGENARDKGRRRGREQNRTS